MPILYTLLFFSLTLVTNAGAQDKRLLGTWQSDKEGTLDYLRKDAKLAPRVIAILESILGKTTITYTKSDVIFANCELAGTYKYRITESTPETLKIVVVGNDGEEGSPSVLTFTSETELWSSTVKPPLPSLSGFREKFVRISK